MTISIQNILNNEYAIFHNEGLSVYEILKNKIENREKTQLSFQGISRCSSQFLNACIGKLYLLYKQDQIDSLLTFENTNELLDLKIKDVIENAINSKEYDSLIDKALC